MKMTVKTIFGFVVQTFDENGKCTGQEFVAGDQVEYEDEQGNPVEDEVIDALDHVPTNMSII